MEKENKIIVICGPTATGKSALAVAIAKHFSGEIISADSRQVYRGLDIGSAKITPDEMQGIPHHLIDVANPADIFTVAEFQEQAREKMRSIFSRKNTPIICGGTGMYISALIDNQKFPEVPPDTELRKELEHLTLDELFEKLKILDPVRAETIDRKNPRRLVRAIEVALASTLTPVQSLQKDHVSEYLIVGLNLPKEELLARIEQRINDRIPALFDEIKKLHDEGISWERLDSFGLEYRYGSQYIQGTISFEQFKEILKTKTWQYVKRQMTWFKRDKRIHWMNPVVDQQKILKLVQDFLK